MDNLVITENNNAFVQPEQPANVREQAPVLIQENILQDGGIAATITVGSTTTLEPSSPAYVNNVGDEKHAVLQFGIPKGETGSAGLDGADGQAATIQIGSVETVDSSSDAAVENVGTENAAILNFSIPRGEQGIQGEQGYSPVAYVQQIQGGARIHIADSQTETDVDVMDGQDGAAGQAATITVGSTTTGSAGTNASVVNSGTSSAAIFDFTIPRGADGQDGAAGQDGFSPIATVSQTASGATISITDSQGTTTANITNGVNGTNGTNGVDGFSPIATVSQGTGSATITITDANGTTTATVYDGTTPDTSVSNLSLSNLPAHSGGTNGYSFRKQLNVVCLDLDVIWMNSITADTWTNIATIPSSVVPASSIICPIVMTNGSNGHLFAYGKMNIQTNGNVRVNVNTGLSGLCAVSGSIAWII
ncbi:MAG: hypothetical protein IK117_08440 [Bacteroidales bacterium]|nr:hypothetical protein [Bacteroidales bacterium]